MADSDELSNKDAPELGALAPELLLAAAAGEAGLDDFGDGAFLVPLKRLVSAIVEEANLSATGLAATRARFIQCLVNRLRLQDDLKRHPEILAEDVSDPIVIVGMGRTGTTKLQRMMSSDPGVQKTPFWRLLNPAMLPGWQRDKPDDRIELARVYVAQAFEQQPEFFSAHKLAAEEIEEDGYMLEMTFDGLLPVFQYNVPAYYEWVKARSRQNFYDYEKLLLQYLQWQDGGRRGRPWILKTPAHVGALDTIAATFPKATFIHCHRDIATTFTSILRTAEAYRGLMMADHVDTNDLGAYFLKVNTEEVALNMRQRDKPGAPLRIIEAAYRDIVNNPMAVIRAAYDAHGFGLTPDGTQAMLDWSDRNPESGAGKSSDGLERYGLTKEKVEAAFGAYVKRFAAWL